MATRTDRHITPIPRQPPYIQDETASTNTKSKGKPRAPTKTKPLEVAEPSKFDHLLTNISFSDTQSKATSRRSRKPQVPKAIVFGSKSWANVATDTTERSQHSTGSHYTISSDQSTVRTGKTVREIELEEKIEELMTTNETLAETNLSLQEAHKNIQRRQTHSYLKKTNALTCRWPNLTRD